MSDEKMSVLMCRPTYFGIEYEINPWMHEDNPVDQQKALQQWNDLHDIYRYRLGWDVHLMTPRPGLPDMVFTANSGLVHRNQVILPNFRHVDRQGEPAHFEKWFKKAGYSVSQPIYDFEGEGDALFWRDTLFAGYPWRSDKASHRELSILLGVKAVSLQLTDARFYHLDTAFTVVDDSTVALYPGAFTEESICAVQKIVPNVILASETDALAYGLNAISDGKNIVISDRSLPLISEYERRDYIVHPTPIDEFQKSGGGVKCLTLALRK